MDHKEKKTILFIEDDDVIIRLQLKQLGKKGYNVIHVLTGEEAIKVIFDDKDAIDLILIDIELGSDIDGIETAKTILSEKKIPIVFLINVTEQDILKKTEGIISYGFVEKNSRITFLDATIKMALKIFNDNKPVDVRENITECKKLENELKINKAKLNESQRLSQIGSWELDLITNKLYWTDEVFRIFGLESNKFNYTYEGFLNSIHPDDKGYVNNAYNDSVINKVPYNIVHRILLKNGIVKYVNERGKTFYDKTGKPVRSIGTVQDITERKQAEDKIQKLLSEKEIIMKELLETNTQLIQENAERREIEHNLEWQLNLNKALANVSHNVIGAMDDIQSITRSILDISRELTESEHGYVSIIDMQTGNNISYTLTEMIQGEKCRIAGPEQKIIFSPEPDGTYPGLWGHCLNTRESFFTNEPKTHSATEGVPNGHITITRFLSVPVLFSGVLIGQIALANSKNEYTEKDIEVVERVADYYALAINRYHNLKEREKLISDLRHAQKMEAIGTFAGGIAHDFNNILSAIFGYVEILKINLTPDDEENREYLEELFNAAKRARDLVKQILTFSSQRDQELKPIQPHLIIREVIKFLRSSIPKTIDIRQDISTDCGYIMADPIQIHQIIMNLANNAYQAMQENGGILSIELHKLNNDTEDNINNFKLNSGRYVVLKISDNGPGIPKENLKRIFEPYFTTKEKGEGTGLGLAVVHGIVKSNNGHISVYSELGIGTTFYIYYPVIPSLDIIEEGDLPVESNRGGENILFIDDEEPLADVGKIILESLGYKVVSFVDSIKALEVFKEFPNIFDMIITDMNMPHISGTELVGRVRKIRKDIPIILCSGFSETITSEKAKDLGINAFYSKPMSRQEMAKIVRDVFDKN